MTAAAIACNSSPSPSEGRGEPRRSTWMIPAKPASTELSTKQVILTASVRMPIAADASIWPPVDLIQLPKLVSDRIAASTTAMPANQNIESRMRPT